MLFQFPISVALVLAATAIANPIDQQQHPIFNGAPASQQLDLIKEFVHFYTVTETQNALLISCHIDSKKHTSSPTS